MYVYVYVWCIVFVCMYICVWYVCAATESVPCFSESGVLAAALEDCKDPQAAVGDALRPVGCTPGRRSKGDPGERGVLSARAGVDVESHPIRKGVDVESDPVRLLFLCCYLVFVCGFCHETQTLYVRGKVRSLPVCMSVCLCVLFTCVSSIGPPSDSVLFLVCLVSGLVLVPRS